MGRLVILGGGESGTGSAVLGKKYGWDVFLSDRGQIADRYRDILTGNDISFEEGRHTEKLILNADLVVKSPGIPDTVPIVESIRAKGIPVVSEIEFAGRYSRAKTICITGSNGKTTTTALVHRILREAGYDARLAGNIGESFAMQVACSEREWYVLELSSFQLDGMEEFRADIAVITNITPDHLDRYGNDMDNYMASKLRIVRNQTPGDLFIYNGDDMNITSKCSALDLPMKQLPFGAGPGLPKGLDGKAGEGAYMTGDGFSAEAFGKKISVKESELRIKGRHNVMNAMAATLAGMAAGVDERHIREALCSFGGIEHRMETVGEFDGVLYINDSKATNVDAVWYALESMKRPVVWIAGGTDKGNDYSQLDDVVKGRVRTLVAMGKDTGKLTAHFKRLVPEIHSTDNLDDAMTCAAKSARPGDVVLLSPACASFDLFKNYEDRGGQFKRWIKDSNKKDDGQSRDS